MFQPTEHVQNQHPQQADKAPALPGTGLALLVQTSFTECDFISKTNNKIPIIPLAKDSST